jgi:hypothetical protein
MDGTMICAACKHVPHDGGCKVFTCRCQHPARAAAVATLAAALRETLPTDVTLALATHARTLLRGLRGKDHENGC